MIGFDDYFNEATIVKGNAHTVSRRSANTHTIRRNVTDCLSKCGRRASADRTVKVGQGLASGRNQITTATIDRSQSTTSAPLALNFSSHVSFLFPRSRDAQKERRSVGFRLVNRPIPPIPRPHNRYCRRTACDMCPHIMARHHVANILFAQNFTGERWQ